MNSLQRSTKFDALSWCAFEYDNKVQRWVDSVLPQALGTIHAIENKQWLRCGGTWFVGVNALANNSAGALGNGAPLSGRAMEFVHKLIVDDRCSGNTGAHLKPGLMLDRAQISVCFL